MRINKDLVLRQIGNEYIIINPNGDSVNISNVYSLNETAAYLYNKLYALESFTIEECTKFLLCEYDIDEDTVLTDLKDLLNQWKELNLIIED